VTLLVVAISADAMLVGSDGQSLVAETDEAPGFLPYALRRSEKFVQIRDYPLLWGLVGASSERREFGEWIEDDLPIASWQQLTDAVWPKVAELNTRIRERKRAAGVHDPVPAGELFSIVLAGYVGADADVVMVDEDGQVMSHGHQPRVAFGPMAPTFSIAMQVLNTLAPDVSLDDPDTFIAALQTFVGVCPSNVFPPVDVWRLTGASCERLT
jgi:hypothetical protein